MKYKKVIITGKFNIIHPGHIRILEFAKSISEKLIVGVLSDKLAKDDSFIKDKTRLLNIKSIKLIDEAQIIKNSIEQFIQTMKPDAVIKGFEYKNKFNIEKKFLDKIGSKLIFSSGTANLSSADLLKKEFSSSYMTQINADSDYLKRYKIKNDKIKNTVNSFKGLKVIVVGDTIIDEYQACESIGMSREDTSIAVKPIEKRRFLGGAAILAAHASSLGAKTKFISVIGDDGEHKFLKKNLEKEGVFTNLIKDKSRITTKKVRFRSGNTTLLRFNEFDQSPISNFIENKVLNLIKKEINKTDLIILSDFSYGVITKKLVDTINKFKTKNKKLIIVGDSQSSSQIGDITKFSNFDLTTPTEYEIRLGLRDFSSGLVELGLQAIKQNISKNVIITLNKEGVLIQQGKEKFSTDKIAALSNVVRDPAGAGDCFLCACSMSFALNKNLWISSYIGSLAAAIQIQKIGNLPIKKNEILNSLK